jgi:hypothetical protein
MPARTRTFLCCLPVRLGVFLLSLIAMAVGAFVAAVGWIRISQLSQHPLTRSDRIALWIHTIMFSILGLLAVLGFIGCLAKSRRMVAGFAIALAIHLGFSVASGIFSIYLFFRQTPQEALDTCANGSTDPSVIDSCKNGTGIMKGVMIAIYVVTWLIQLYAYFIVEWYVDQLDDEEMEKHAVGINNMAQTSINYGPTYAFSSPPNAHGVQDASSRV